MRILWHVSSHGWGHAARQRELIGRWKSSHPEGRVFLATDVPEWFWQGSPVHMLLRGSPSPTVLESGWSIDLPGTLQGLRNFIGSSVRLLESEIAFQDELSPDLVVSDIDPLPIAAASERGIPGVGIANFTWDWVMEGLFPFMAPDTAVIAEMYKGGTYLRLPLGPEHCPFGSRVDVPLLPGGCPGESVSLNNLLPDGRICLVALRQMPPRLELRMPPGLTAVSSSPEPVHKGIRNIVPEDLRAANAGFPDLVKAADVVLSKPGYGIVSQILSLGKPCVLITGRGFPEEEYLLEPLKGRLATEVLDQGSLHPLPELLEQAAFDSKPEPAAAEGVEFILQGHYLET